MVKLGRSSLIAVALAAFLAVSLLSSAPQAQAASRTLYVATWGADYNPDGWSTPPNSAAKPWKTIAMTIRRARPGDTIVVRGGTYVEAAGWGAVRATSKAPIRVKNAPGERVVLKGTLQMDRADYWIFDGIDVTYNPARGRTEFLVKFDGGVGWQFLNGEVWGSRGVSNMMISGSAKNGVPKHYRIAGNCIHDNEATGDPLMNDHNIYLMPGYASGPGRIERNILFNAENGANIKAAGPNSSTGAARVTISHNTMSHAGAGVTLAYATHRTTLWRNLIGPKRGGGDTRIAGVFARHLRGYGNVAGHTAVTGYPRSVVSTEDSTQPIRAQHTAWVTPKFDNMTTCSGFRPQDPTAARYGRYAA